METIRKNCFETNSSSTHTLTMCMKSDYKKWENGELYYYPYNQELITPERMERIVRNHMLDEEIHCDYREKTITYNGKTIALVAHKAPQLALDVITKGMTWQEAIDSDWRKTKNWQPGWMYEIK